MKFNIKQAKAAAEKEKQKMYLLIIPYFTRKINDLA